MIADPPEASMCDVAEGVLDDLSRPIYFACGHDVERRQFLEMHGLAPHEVLRVRHAYQIPSQCREDKVLILAPRWGEDRRTEAFVQWWVDCDRYTCAIDLEPIPVDESDDRPFLATWALWIAIGCGFAAGFSFFASAPSLGWAAAAAGWIAAFHLQSRE
jgi:hypothetical protein